LISRGNCTFLIKSTLANKAGAVGAVIYNNVPGQIAAITLGSDDSPLGKPVPTIGISRENGTPLADVLKAGTAVTGALYVKTVVENVTT
jgi:carboxypeptidase Q